MDLRTSTISTTSDVISESYMSTSKSTDFIKPKDEMDTFRSTGGTTSTSNGEGNHLNFKRIHLHLDTNITVSVSLSVCVCVCYWTQFHSQCKSHCCKFWYKLNLNRRTLRQITKRITMAQHPWSGKNDTVSNWFKFRGWRGILKMNCAIKEIKL